MNGHSLRMLHFFMGGPAVRFIVAAIIVTVEIKCELSGAVHIQIASFTTSSMVQLLCCSNSCASPVDGISSSVNVCISYGLLVHIIIG